MDNDLVKANDFDMDCSWMLSMFSIEELLEELNKREVLEKINVKARRGCNVPASEGPMRVYVLKE